MKSPLRWYYALVILCTIVFIVVAAKEARGVERYRIYDTERNIQGDIYDPGHNRRLQIRDKDRNIIGYIEADGTLTDNRRRELGHIGQPGDLQNILEGVTSGE